MYGHKENVSRSMINNLQNRRNVKCYACNIFQHVANQCRSRRNKINFRPKQENVVCYACNKSDHIAKYCRSINVNRRGPEDKNKNVKVDEKGKLKVDEIKDQMKKICVKKSGDNAVNGSTLDSGTGTISGN